MMNRGNRATRRRAAAKGEPKNGDRFFAKCQLCEAESCLICVIERDGEELGICQGCPCAQGKCDGMTGVHWLGCTAVGISTSDDAPRPPRVARGHA